MSILFLFQTFNPSDTLVSTVEIKDKNFYMQNAERVIIII